MKRKSKLCPGSDPYKVDCVRMSDELSDKKYNRNSPNIFSPLIRVARVPGILIGRRIIAKKLSVISCAKPFHAPMHVTSIGYITRYSNFLADLGSTRFGEIRIDSPSVHRGQRQRVLLRAYISYPGRANHLQRHRVAFNLPDVSIDLVRG